MVRKLISERMYVMIAKKDSSIYLSFTLVEPKDIDHEYDVLIMNTDWGKVRSLASELGCEHRNSDGYEIIQCFTSYSTPLITIALLLNAYEDVQHMVKNEDLTESIDTLTLIMNKLLYSNDAHEIDAALNDYNKIIDILQRGFPLKIARLFIEDTWKEPLELYNQGLVDEARELAQYLINECLTMIREACTLNSNYIDLCEELQAILIRYKGFYDRMIID